MKSKYFQQLNIVYVEHDRVWSYCPFHKDTIRPNLSISLLDKYYGRYKCWACPAEGNLSKEQMERLNLKDFVIHRDSDVYITRWKQFTTDCYNNLRKFPLLKLGLAKELNISTKILDKWKVGYDGKGFTVPMFREDLRIYNLEDYICGIQHRFSDGTKRCMAGSQLGLMYPYDYIGGYCIFICEGFSDGIAVNDLGFQSISRPHCRYIEGMRAFLRDILEVSAAVIIPDNDTVGKEGAAQLEDELNALSRFDEDGWKIDIEVYMFSFDGAKDIRDYIAKVGKEKVKKELQRYL